MLCTTRHRLLASMTMIASSDRIQFVMVVLLLLTEHAFSHTFLGSVVGQKEVVLSCHVVPRAVSVTWTLFTPMLERAVIGESAYHTPRRQISAFCKYRFGATPSCSRPQ